jgi:hypothetical protein
MELVERRMGSMSCASVERERESFNWEREREERRLVGDVIRRG